MGQLLKFSLEDHLTECETRYKDLQNKIDAVDERLSNIEQLVLEIKALLTKGAGS